MEFIRRSAFPALLVSASLIGKPTGAGAFSLIPPRPENLQTQKRRQPLDADTFDFKALNQAEPIKKAGIWSLEPREKAETLQVLKAKQPSERAGNSAIPIYQKPDSNSALTPNDATLLAKSAIEEKKLPDQKLLMEKIKTPWDLRTGDQAISKVLEQANINATPEQVRANNEQALLLKEKMEQSVLHEGTRSWLGKFCLLKARLSMMKDSIKMRMFSEEQVRSYSLAMDGVLKDRKARLLSECFILNKPLETSQNRLEKLLHVIAFKDLEVLEEQAIQVLEKACQNAKSPQDKTQLAMNFIVMSHEVGARHKERVKDLSWARFWSGAHGPRGPLQECLKKFKVDIF
jgi:hypothetical protein